MEWMWLIPLNVALLIVPAMVGVWAWSEVIERIREDHASLGRRTRALRTALVATSATYLVGGGTWVHPATIEFVLATDPSARLGLYALIIIPWTAFGVIGILARMGRRTGLEGFLEERSRHSDQIQELHGRSRAFLHAIGLELEHTLRQIESRVEHIDRGDPMAVPDEGRGEPMERLHNLASALQIPVPPEPDDLSLDEPLAEALEKVRCLAEERAISVFRSGIEGRRVRAGHERVRQILQTLLEGGLERAPRGEGILVIGIRDAQHQDVVEVTVSDNGAALAAEELARAFALDHEADPNGTHFGLGYPLAVARRLARQDGGDLRIVPQANGGTALVLTLPTTCAQRDEVMCHAR